jgi:hypothetical protein
VRADAAVRTVQDEVVSVERRTQPLRHVRAEDLRAAIEKYRSVPRLDDLGLVAVLS